MFDKFGEFDGYEELNLAAAGLRAEKDQSSLMGLAEENGIDVEDVRDFWDGTVEELATPFSAAMGRISIQEKVSKLPEHMKDVLYTMVKVMVQENIQFRYDVMRKGKRIDGIIDEMRKEAQKTKQGNVGCVCGTDRELQERIRRYFDE